MASSKNREIAADDEMDVLRPLDADRMDDAEQEDDVEDEEEEGYEDGGSMSAQMHQFLTEMDLDLAQRKQTLKSFTKVGSIDSHCVHVCATIINNEVMSWCSQPEKFCRSMS